jgi:predicted small lipoprotein YifL
MRYALLAFTVTLYLASLVGCMNEHRIGHPPESKPAPTAADK